MTDKLFPFSSNLNRCLAWHPNFMLGHVYIADNPNPVQFSTLLATPKDLPEISETVVDCAISGVDTIRSLDTSPLGYHLPFIYSADGIEGVKSFRYVRGFEGCIQMSKTEVDRLRGRKAPPFSIYVVTRILEKEGRAVLAELTDVSINQQYIAYFRYPSFDMSSDRVGVCIRWYHNDGGIVDRIFREPLDDD